MKPTIIKLRNSKVALATIYKETQLAKFYARTKMLNTHNDKKWSVKEYASITRANSALSYFKFKLHTNKEFFIGKCGGFIQVFAPTIEYVGKDIVYVSVMLKNEYGQATGFETVKFTELYVPCE